MAFAVSTKYVHDSVPSTVMCWCKAITNSLKHCNNYLVVYESTILTHNYTCHSNLLKKGTDYESLYIIMLSSQIMDCSLV